MPEIIRSYSSHQGVPRRVRASSMSSGFFCCLAMALGSVWVRERGIEIGLPVRLVKKEAEEEGHRYNIQHRSVQRGDEFIAGKWSRDIFELVLTREKSNSDQTIYPMRIFSSPHTLNYVEKASHQHLASRRGAKDKPDTLAN